MVCWAETDRKTTTMKMLLELNEADFRGGQNLGKTLAGE